MRIKISPFAELDLDQSISYYNEWQENLGEEFFENVNIAILRIKVDPGQFPKHYKEMRRAKTERFPFNIFFVVKNDIGYIIGIFHFSRNPQEMIDRFKSGR